MDKRCYSSIHKRGRHEEIYRAHTTSRTRPAIRDGNQSVQIIYGISEVSDAWYHKLRREIDDKLKMHSLTGDRAHLTDKKPIDPYQRTKPPNEKDESSHLENENEPFEGMIGTYVEELIFSGTDKFREESQMLDESIKMKPASDTPLTFELSLGLGSITKTMAQLL